MKEIDNEKVIKAYNNGQSMNSIARELNTYPTTISRILEKNHIELRHDNRKKGEYYVSNGEKLLEWAKAQGRLVTKSELAKIIGRKKLSPSYFIKYPELGQYIKTTNQKSLDKYINKLYLWLKANNIPYKPQDRKTLAGLSVDALLLGDYEHLALDISEKAPYVSRKKHAKIISEKTERAKTAKLTIIFLNKKQLENLDEVKTLLDDLKN